MGLQSRMLTQLTSKFMHKIQFDAVDIDMPDYA